MLPATSQGILISAITQVAPGFARGLNQAEHFNLPDTVKNPRQSRGLLAFRFTAQRSSRKVSA